LKKFSTVDRPPTISIVLPCYNPPEYWCRTLVRHISELDHKLAGYALEYIISNDGSTRLDRGQVRSLTEDPRIVFLDLPVNKGKGAAIRAGAAVANGNIIIYTDLDFPFGTEAVAAMVNVFEQHPGCRFVYGRRCDSYFSKLPFKRRLVSRGLQLFNRIFFFGLVIDTQAGIKGFRRTLLPVVQEIKTNTFVFEIELMRKLIRRKIEMRPVEVWPAASITFTDFRLNTLLKETRSLARIILFQRIWNDFS